MTELNKEDKKIIRNSFIESLEKINNQITDLENEIDRLKVKRLEIQKLNQKLNKIE